MVDRGLTARRRPFSNPSCREFGMKMDLVGRTPKAAPRRSRFHHEDEQASPRPEPERLTGVEVRAASTPRRKF